MIKGVDVQRHREQADCYRRCPTSNWLRVITWPRLWPLIGCIMTGFGQASPTLLLEWFHLYSICLIHQIHNKSSLWPCWASILCLCLCDDNFTDISNCLGAISSLCPWLRHSGHGSAPLLVSSRDTLATLALMSEPRPAAQTSGGSGSVHRCRATQTQREEEGSYLISDQF